MGQPIAPAAMNTLEKTVSACCTGFAALLLATTLNAHSEHPAVATALSLVERGAPRVEATARALPEPERSGTVHRVRTSSGAVVTIDHDAPLRETGSMHERRIGYIEDSKGLTRSVNGPVAAQRARPF